MPTYLVHGFRRQNTGRGTVSIIVDVDHFMTPHGGSAAAELAESIAGAEFCFHASQNIDVPVPTDCKNTLFQNNDGLYARVPQLDWRRPRRRKKSK